MAVHHRLDVGTAAIDLRMDEAFKIGFGLAAVHDTGIQVELKNIVRRNKSGSQAPRDKKMFWVGRVALTDMAEAIDDPLPKQDVVGKSQFSRDSEIEAHPGPSEMAMCGDFVRFSQEKCYRAGCPGQYDGTRSGAGIRSGPE